MNQKENHLSLEQRSSPKCYIIVGFGWLLCFRNRSSSNTLKRMCILTAQIENYKLVVRRILDGGVMVRVARRARFKLWASEVNQLSSGFQFFKLFRRTDLPRFVLAL